MVRLAWLALLPLLALSSPDRRNSKRLQIWDAVPDTGFRSGRQIESARARQGNNPAR